MNKDILGAERTTEMLANCRKMLFDLTYSSLELVAEGGNNGTDRSTDTSEAETGNGGSNIRRKVDKEGLAISTDNGEKLLDGGTDVVDKLAGLAGVVNNLAERHTNAWKVEATDESSNGRAQLNEETLSIVALNLNDIPDLGDDVSKDLVTLQVVASGNKNSTNGNADTGKTETRKKTSDNRGELDEQVITALTNNGQQTVNLGAEAGNKLTNGAGAGDDGTDSSSKRRETEGRKKTRNLRGELDQELLGVRASDGKDTIKLVAGILDDVSAALTLLVFSLVDGLNNCRGRSRSKGRCGRGSSESGGSDAEVDVSGPGLGLSRSSSDRGGHGREGSDERSLHGEGCKRM